MQSARKAIVAAAAAAALQGCAGSGGDGGGGGGENGLLNLARTLVCGYSLGAACVSTQAGTSTTQTNNASSASAPAVTGLPPAETAFTSWTELKASQSTTVVGPRTRVGYMGLDGADPVRITGTVLETFNPSEEVLVQYGAQGILLEFEQFRQSAEFLNLDAVGQPGIDVVRNPISGVDQPKIPFTSTDGYQVGLVANPYGSGWNYQSFGAWNRGDVRDGGYVQMHSFGAATPGNAVPTSGSATFTGKLGGFYVSPAGEGSIAAGKLSVNANFASRSLSFASSGTTLTRDFSTATAAPQLNLNGTLTYSPGADAFNGTLTNAGGTMSGTSNGQFYGPAAQELGGVFTVKSPTTVETFAGAYGAIR